MSLLEHISEVCELFFSIYDFLNKNPSPFVCTAVFSIFRPFIYCAASWISHVCSSFRAAGHPKTFWSFYAQPPPAALYEKADNTDVISVPLPFHRTAQISP